MIIRNAKLRGVISTIMFTSAILCGVMLTNSIVVFAGDTLPYEGTSKRGQNQPYFHGYRISDIKDWSPQTDKYGKYMRAHVPLEERNKAFAPTQANPKLDPTTEFFNLSGDYGNAFFDSNPETNKFSQYLFNFWQYTDYYGSWHGLPTAQVPEKLYDCNDSWEYRYFEFGILNLPNPAYTNAAHKNGVLSLGCIFLPRPGQYYSSLFEKDKNGKFTIADKLAEMCEYYGFDGYFINQEESIEPDEVDLYKEFIAYLRDKGIYIQWYDSIVDSTGELNYENEFNENNDSFLKDEKFGKKKNDYRIADSIFLNYWWNKDMLKKSQENAKELGIDPKTSVFVGAEGGKDRFYQEYDLRDNLGEDGQPMNSIATLGGDFVHDGLDGDLGGEIDLNKRQQNEYQWMTIDRERMWYSGVNQDPTKVVRDPAYNRPEIGVNDATKWDGVSAYITERSVINGTNFVSNFNTGHGLEYVVNGEISNSEEWSNINIQDILPTWQWWIDTNGTKLNVEFDYGAKYTKDTQDSYAQIGAYEGGSSLVVNGKLDSENFLRLYKTDLDVNSNSSASITFKKVSDDTNSKMKLGIIFKDDPEKVVYFDIDNSGVKTGEWVTSNIDLSKYQNRKIAVIGLGFSSDSIIDNYQMNIGKIAIADGSAVVPNKPTGFEIESAIADTDELFLRWNLDEYDTTKKYNIYAVDESGKDIYLGGTYDDVYYIKNVPSKTVKLKLTATGADGRESEAATTNFDFNTKVRNVDVIENLGYIDVKWENPTIDYSEIKIDFKLDNTENQEIYTTTVEKGNNTARLNVSEINGQPYTLSISIIDKFGREGKPIDYKGKLVDKYSEPYDGNVMLVEKGKVKLSAPNSDDWWHMYVYEDGKVKEQTTNNQKYNYYIRGKNNLNSIPVTGSGKLTVVLEDYNGNMSNPTTITYDEVKDN